MSNIRESQLDTKGGAEILELAVVKLVAIINLDSQKDAVLTDDRFP